MMVQVLFDKDGKSITEAAGKWTLEHFGAESLQPPKYSKE